MPDIFDEVSSETEKRDIFDEIAGERFTMEPGMVLPSQVPQSQLTEPRRLRDVIGLTGIGEALGIGRGPQREMQREFGGAAEVLPQDILSTGFQFLAPPPQIAEPIRTVTEPAIEALPKSIAGVATGVREVSLGFPVAAAGVGMGTNLGRALLGLFSGEFALSIPERWEQFQAARAKGDDREAWKIATETLLTGGLLALGGKKEISDVRLERANRAVAEAAERARQVGLEKAAREAESAALAEQQRPMPVIGVAPGGLPSMAAAPSGLALEQPPAPARIYAGTIPPTPELLALGLHEIQPPLTPPTLQPSMGALSPREPGGAQAQRVRVAGEAIQRAREFPQALAEKVAQDIETAPESKPLTENQLRIMQESLTEAVQRQQIVPRAAEPAAPAAQPQEPYAKTEIETSGGIPPERQSIPAERGTETQIETGTPLGGRPGGPQQEGQSPVLLIDRVARSTGTEFEQLMQQQPRGLTLAARDLGEQVRRSANPSELLERLDREAVNASAQARAARSSGDMNEVFRLATKPQYFREAAEAARGISLEAKARMTQEEYDHAMRQPFSAARQAVQTLAEATPPSEQAVGIVPTGTEIAMETVGNPSWWSRHFTSARGLPEKVPQEWTKRMGTVRSEVVSARYAARDLAKELRRIYNIGPLRDLWEGLSGVPRPVFEQIQNVLTGVADSNTLHESIRPHVEKMRTHVDNLSKQISEGLRAEGKPELASAIDENLNAYLTRSYRIFDDPKWVKNIPVEARRNAESFIAERLLESRPDLAPAQARQMAETRLREMLADWSDAGVDKLFRAGKLGSKDLSLFMRRKELAPQIRAVLGEYGDPVTNFTKTITKQARWLADTEFLNQVRQLGMGKWLFEEGQAPAGFEHRIAAESSSTMAPLNGLRTSPEIAKVFEQFNRNPITENFLARAYFAINGWSKQAATVFSALTQGRNLWGNPLFNTAAGHWNFKDYGKAFKTQWADIAGNDAKAREFYRDMTRHGLADENPVVSELRASMRDAGLQDPSFEDYSSRGMARVLRKAISAPQRSYRLSDEMGKQVGWMAERSDLAKAHPDWTETQVKAAAAERVRNTYPTYSMLPEWVIGLRKQPLFGPFLTFRYERMRNLFWNLRYGVEDLRSGNPAQIAAGARRLAGTAAVMASGAALGKASAALFGIKKDTEEDVRRFLPPWSKNDELVWLDKDGTKLRYMNWSYLNPDADMHNALVAAMQGDQKGIADSMAAGLAEFFRPFISEQMLASAIADVARNKTEDGREVYNPEDDPGTKLNKIGQRFASVVQPGTVRRLQQRILPALRGEVSRAGQPLSPTLEIGSELTGLRSEQVDLMRAAQFKARAFNEGERDARRIATTTLFAVNPPTAQAGVEAYRRADAARRALWTEMQGDIRALLRQGASAREVMNTLEDAGVSKSDQIALISGQYKPLDINAESYRRIGKQPDWNVLVPIMTERTRSRTQSR